MKITDITVTLFAWDDIPATQYGRHSGRFSGKSDLGLVTIKTDQGLEGHAFLGSSSRPASAGDANLIVKVAKPMLVGEDPLDRERHFQRLWARMRMNNQLRPLGAVDVALWDLAGKIANMPVHRLMGSYRRSAPAYASSAVLRFARGLLRGGAVVQGARLDRLQDPSADRVADRHPHLRGGAQGGRRRLPPDARFDMVLRLYPGAQGRPGRRATGLLLVRGPARRGRPHQLCEAAPEALRSPFLRPSMRPAATRPTRPGSFSRRPTTCAATWP